MLYLDAMLLQARAKLHSFFTKEDGDVNVVSIVVLIGIAIVLAVLFKDNVKNLLNSLFNTINGNATNAIQ